MSRLGRTMVVLLYAFLLAPLAVVLLTSFSNDGFLAFPPRHWGIAGYRALLDNAPFQAGLQRSVVLAVTVTLATLMIGTASAFAIARYSFRGRGVLLAIFTAPLLMPTIVLALALLLVFARIGLLATFPGLVLGHCLVALPYVIRIVLTALRGIPATLEDAAATLGARPFQVFRRVTLPLVRPAIVATVLFGFTLSFDEFIRTFFISGRNRTVPVYLWELLSDQMAPFLPAVGVVVTAISVLASLIGFLVSAWAGRKGAHAQQ